MNERKRLQASIKSGLCFFTGAGISISPPSCLPSGKQITSTIFNLLFSRSKLNEIDVLNKKDDSIKEKLFNLPMELIWEVLIRVSGNDILDCLSILESDKPNKDHIAIALSCEKANNNIIFTLNFDTLQEKAISLYTNKQPRSVATEDDFNEFNSCYKDFSNNIWVVHLHNIISNENYKELATTVSSIGIGLPGYKANPFIRVLKTKDIICAGYSNGDIDTFPILANTKNNLFWYLYEGDLPLEINEYHSSLNNRLVVIKRDSNEKGFWNILSSLDSDINKELSKIRQQENQDISNNNSTDRLTMLEESLIEKFGSTDAEIIKSCRLAVAILCDEVGERGIAEQIYKLNLTQKDSRKIINYSEYMLSGHLNERLGNVAIAVDMFSKAKAYAPSKIALQETRLELCSAKLGLWKRNPLKFYYLLNWLLFIKIFSHSPNIRIKQRSLWEMGDLVHFVAEFLLIPSSAIIYIAKEKMSKRLNTVASTLDYITLLLFGKLRKFMLKIAISHYARMLRLTSNKYMNQIPGYTSLASMRLAEVLAGYGKLRLAHYALKKVKRGESFYKWVNSEHGKANATCAKAVVAFYDLQFTKSLDLFTQANQEYRTHCAGILKSNRYIFRVRHWDRIINNKLL